MKSFADWTQELAESVGEIKHHWEEPSADPNAPILDDTAVIMLDALNPSQLAFPHSTRSPTAECEDCHVTFSCLLDEWESPFSGNHYRMCVNCALKNGYMYVPPNP